MLRMRRKGSFTAGDTLINLVLWIIFLIVASGVIYFVVRKLAA